jgi:hypothetical protein
MLGATAMLTPYFLAIPSHVLASFTAFLPVASLYVLKFISSKGSFISFSPYRKSRV